MELEETTEVIIECPRCKVKNSADSIFCKNCGLWLVTQWEGVFRRGRGPLNFTLKIGPRAPESMLKMPLLLRQKITGSLSISGGRDDIVFHVKDPNGNIVAGREALRRSDRYRGKDIDFSFQAYVPGAYTFTFDNIFSTFSSKIVTMSISGF